MISLSSTGELVRALHHARDISLTAYTLAQGSVLDALRDAARRGAHVRVRLEGYIYKDDGSIKAANDEAIAQLSRAGADAKVVHGDVSATDAMLHLKGAVVDGVAYLDDRNWPGDGGDTIVRDTFSLDARMVRDGVSGRGDRATSFFAVRKRDALASEARLLDGSRAGDDVVVESESFGNRNRVYNAIDAAAKRGVRVRLLVAARDIERNAVERQAIARLERDGVAVRVCDADEKFAVVAGSRGWLGSANATAAFNRPDQLDWGLRTDDARTLSHLRSAFETRWAEATAV